MVIHDTIVKNHKYKVCYILYDFEQDTNSHFKALELMLIVKCHAITDIAQALLDNHSLNKYNHKIYFVLCFINENEFQNTKSKRYNI